MERLLFECAVRATLFAIVTALALWGMRIKNAGARHRVWSGVVVLMLALPFWTAWGPHVSVPVLPSRPQPAIAWNVAAEAIPAIAEETSSYSRVVTGIGSRPRSAKAQLSSGTVIWAVYI